MSLMYRGRIEMVVLVGDVMLALGGWYAYTAIHLVVAGDRVTGHVASVMRTPSSGRVSYQPTIEYEVDGHTYRRDGTANSKHEPHVGDTRTVLVDPGNPEESRIDAGVELWATPAVLLVFGALALWAVWWRTLRGSRRVR
jgi:hypothetical protein